ncbi:MAG: hypothetical protein C0601_11575 [Candidatus Muiribacterium halophilum]|uniref:VWFA domain-containing protein n=1 Tax=Muiribacterium halophilum TaxID=2053465 RepID=A0A2N5ZBM6_MUIH1|nr:MAG: hypothetical protein C0601_11575 [Candidatus Muirbacterium halophilum]
MKKIIMGFILISLFFSTMALDVRIERLQTEHYPVINPVVQVSEDEISLSDVKPEDVDVWVKTKVPFSIENARMPLNIIMLFDKSGSMRDTLPKLKIAASRFLDILKAEDKVMLAAFDQKTYLLQDFTKNRELIKESLKDLKGDGPTLFYDTIDFALEKAKEIDGYTCIVAFTDGRDERFEGSRPISKVAPEDIVKEAVKLKVPIHIIGFGEYIDKEIMSFIADGTNGKFYYAPKKSRFDRIYENIADSFNNLLNISYTTPFKDWYGGRREVVVQVKRKGKTVEDEESYIHEESHHLIDNTLRNTDVMKLMEKVPRITVVATDRENRLIDGTFKILVNCKVADSGDIQKGTAVINLKDYFFDDEFRRVPDDYEKMHKKTVLLPPDLKLRVFTTEADDQFIPMVIKIVSLDGKREYRFHSTIDGIGTELMTQDIIPGVYSLKVLRNSEVLLKDIINIEKGYRLTREYKFGRIIFRKDYRLFGDKENSGLLVDIYDEYTRSYMFRDKELYKLTGGESYMLLPPGRYKITLKNRKDKAQVLRGNVEFQCIILGGENIRTNLKKEDIAKF